MAAVVKSTKAGYDAISASKCIVISELLTAGIGAAFEKLAPVYIDSDGEVRPATDDSTNELNCDGFAMSENDSTGGLPCTIMGLGLIMEWLEDSDDYTPGTRFYVGATNQLETTGTTPVAMAINNKEIIVIAAPGLRAAVA
jgi:hypothetical protein